MSFLWYVPPSFEGRGADDRSTLLLMLGIYRLIPSPALNPGSGSGVHLPYWHSMSLLPSPSKSSSATRLYLTPSTFPSLHITALSPPGPTHWSLRPCALFARSPALTYSAYLPNPIYHQIAFATILLSSVGRLFYLTHCLPASSSKHRLINTFLKGIAIFAGGFGIWNIDNIFCDQLRTIRDFLGPVLGMVVQGHGFWHLMTGYGSYLIFTAAICKYPSKVTYG
jgi:hypothetical protein